MPPQLEATFSNWPIPKNSRLMSSQFHEKCANRWLVRGAIAGRAKVPQKARVPSPSAQGTPAPPGQKQIPFDSAQGRLSGLKPPRNDKREAVWHPSAPLRAGSEVVSFPKRTSEDARAYIDNRPRAGALAPTSTTAHERGRSRLHRQQHAGGSARAYIDKVHERDARAYINNRPRARAPAPHATWAGRGVSRTPSLKSREDRHPPLTAESNSSAENLGHSPEGWQNSETYAALAGE